MRREGGKLLWSKQKGGKLLREKRAAGSFPWSDKGGSILRQEIGTGSFALCRKGGRLLRLMEKMASHCRSTMQVQGGRLQDPQKVQRTCALWNGTMRALTMAAGSLAWSHKGGSLLRGKKGSKLQCVVLERWQAPRLNGKDAKSVQALMNDMCAKGNALQHL